MELKLKKADHFRVGQYVTYNGEFYIITNINTFGFYNKAEIFNFINKSKEVTFEEIEHVKLSADVIKKCGFYRVEALEDESGLFGTMYANSRMLVSVIFDKNSGTENDLDNAFTWEITRVAHANADLNKYRLYYLYELQDAFFINTKEELPVNLLWYDKIKHQHDLSEEYYKTRGKIIITEK